MKDYLSDQGFRVSTAGSGLAMREIMERSAIDLVILDLMMPGEDGLSITQRIRKSNNVGIIILTGKGDPVDQIVGLEIGADDYISKPCDLRQLLARVRSVLRRAKSISGTESGVYTQTLEFASWTLDLGKRQLKAPDSSSIPLTTGEFQLLEALATNPGRVLSRDHLLDITKSRDWSPFDRTIDNPISRLRRKIEEDETSAIHQDGAWRRVRVHTKSRTKIERRPQCRGERDNGCPQATFQMPKSAAQCASGV